MYKSTRKKSDYKIDDIVYYTRIEKSIRSITLKKCIIKKISYGGDMICDLIEDLVTFDKQADYKNWSISYNWLAKTFDEAIQELVDFNEIRKDSIIKILFEQI